MRRWARLLVFSLIMTLGSAASAEYRAFELVITDSASRQKRVVLSTLDPNQYPYYHPIKFTETVTYRATWKCWGNTSHFKPICPNPHPNAKN